MLSCFYSYGYQATVSVTNLHFSTQAIKKPFAIEKLNVVIDILHKEVFEFCASRRKIFHLSDNIMNSETIKGRLSQHVKRRLQSQESTENKISPHVPPATVIANQPNHPTIKEEEIENASVRYVKKRKITKKSQTQSVDLAPPDDDDKCDKRSEKHDTGLDILTLILNHKKSEFLRNPQISELLSDINKKKRNSLSVELIQS